VAPPNLETRVSDLRLVLDAVGSDRPVRELIRISATRCRSTSRRPNFKTGADANASGRFSINKPSLAPRLTTKR
jgi:hypothetical protein